MSPSSGQEATVSDSQANRNPNSTIPTSATPDVSHGTAQDVSSLSSASQGVPDSPVVLSKPPDTIGLWANELSLQPEPEDALLVPPSRQQGVQENGDFSIFDEIGPDNDMMELFSQLPGLDYESWLHNLDDVVSYILPSTGVSGTMQNAISMMREHFQRTSRSASPLTNESNHMWYSSPPRFQVYDRDVLNVFLNLAKVHMASTFKILLPFEAPDGVEEELVAAMAAVGGLFCDVEGSQKVASVLYNDARKMALAKACLLQSRIHRTRLTFHQTASLSLIDFNSCLNRAKTFILIEIYGVCSGDGRSYEFVEAFHGFLLQSVHKCRCLLSGDAISEAERLSMTSLLEALHVLECYRVLLLQRPPTLTALKDGYLDPRGSPNTAEKHGLDDLSALMTLSGKYTGQGDGLASLAAVSSLAWFSSPHGPFGWRRPPLWKTEFVEVALGRWIEAHRSDEEDAGTMLLYHMVHINLHSNLALLRRLACLVAKSGRMPSNAKVFDSIERWLKSRHFDIARWHAESLLKNVVCARSAGEKLNLTGLGSSAHLPKPRRLIPEPPHLPFCAYFATLVLWYGNLLPGHGRLQRNACVAQGAQILFDLNVSVSRNLGHALYELMADEE
ncbi:uncharacterized protein A1O5_09504 [Cladophialophora psammophila CBS 110553]|uniref:Transcription factor domain-containing protein n=1 Tax=Cladophialophora psammophila CBS 110553 TaxID=1182543 RepID=W9WS62_9EURO|nr:uncharacterized protein A1O5_09504 [Cladophialophora psammophila CBS 110553]EXJ67491.1 hypothetical protein A1O5_09504 [Cladophialophora psammophila CBS 110553]